MNRSDASGEERIDRALLAVRDTRIGACSICGKVGLALPDCSLFSCKRRPCEAALESCVEPVKDYDPQTFCEEVNRVLEG